MANFHNLNIKKIVRETADSVVISFEIPTELLTKYEYSAGQYTSLMVDIDGVETIRDYSICSHIDEDLSVGVKKLKNGLMSSFLNSSIKVGDSIKVSEPRGRFTIQGNLNCIIAIAAGSGITPIMSMLKQVLLNTDKNFYLVYSNKSEKTTMFLSQIKELKNQFQSRFFVKFVFTSKDVASHHFGRITETNIFDMLKFPENKFKLLQSSIYICGPEKMIDNISLALEKGGLLKENISYELFSSSKKDNLVSSESGDVLVTFTVDDFTSKVKSSKKKTILDTALDNDIDAPYSCNGGVCGSCIGKLTKGEVKMLNNTVLTESEIEDGLILACQALAVSDELDIDFDDV